MAITVTNDIDHPAAHANVSKQPTDLFAKWDVARVSLVTGLDTGVTLTTETLAASLMLQAALTQAGVPQLQSICPGPAGAAGAIAVSNSVIAIPQSDNSCYIVTQYQNPLPGQPLAFIVSDDTSLSAESTQLHPANKQPMLMTYQAPNATTPPKPAALQAVNSPYATMATIGAPDPAAKPEQYQATFKYSRPVRKVAITGYVMNTNLNPYRNAIGSVNGSPWLGYKVGYWRFDRFAANGILFGNIQKITVDLSSRVNENWMSWEVFNSPDLGRRVTVNPADVQTLQQGGYFYGFSWLNGIITAGLYPVIDFGALFGIPNSGSAPTTVGPNAPGLVFNAPGGGAIGAH